MQKKTNTDVYEQVKKSKTVKYLLNRLNDNAFQTGTDHVQGKLCFERFFSNSEFDCQFCNCYKNTLNNILVFYAKKNHELKMRNINSIIRSVPPNGVDYIDIKIINEKSGLFSLK